MQQKVLVVFYFESNFPHDFLQRHRHTKSKVRQQNQSHFFVLEFFLASASSLHAEIQAPAKRPSRVLIFELFQWLNEIPDEDHDPCTQGPFPKLPAEKADR